MSNKNNNSKEACQPKLRIEKLEVNSIRDSKRNS